MWSSLIKFRLLLNFYSLFSEMTSVLLNHGTSQRVKHVLPFSSEKGKVVQKNVLKKAEQ